MADTTEKKNMAPEALPAGDGASDTVAVSPAVDAPFTGYEADFDVTEMGPQDFEPGELLSVYRQMLRSRRLDEKMLTLLKQGKGFFHIGCAGHEAAQAAVGMLSRAGEDWFSFYYRDLTMYLMTGGSVRDVLLHQIGRAHV